MQWLRGANNQASKQLEPREKLKALRDLAEEAITRGYEAESSGNGQRALKLYKTGLEAVEEALSVPCVTTGLGSRADSVMNWREELESWRCNLTMSMEGLRSNRPPTHPPLNPLLSRRSGIKVPANSKAEREKRKVGTTNGPSSSSSKASNDELDKYRESVLSEIIDNSQGGVLWKDIAGLEAAKQALTEAVILPSVRADLFKGLREPVKGLLLYGPPGNGKTFLAKALANEARCTFFSISASSLTSKWIGEGEKLVRALFQVAAEKQPSIIFMDEIDSVLSARGGNEHDAMRRLKTEFLVQFDGVNSNSEARIIVFGATNRPQDLDEAVLRRLVKRIYIPLPDVDGRRSILRSLLLTSSGSTSTQTSSLSTTDIERIANATQGYSASDLTALCKEAAMNPVREKIKGPASVDAIKSLDVKRIRPIGIQDFSVALLVIKPQQISLEAYERFTQNSGSRA
jgi:spastin